MVAVYSETALCTPSGRRGAWGIGRTRTLAKVIAVANQKGGVGKTTTSVNLTASLAATRRRVLLIDLDPQGNATMGAGVDKYALARSSFDVLLGEAPVMEVAVTVGDPPYDVVPANDDLTGADVALLEEIGRELRLRTALGPALERYDYIIVDCPPALNMLTVNALTAANSIIIPTQCEYYALEGLTALLTTIDKIRTMLNPGLEIEGVLRTMYDPRNNLATDVSGQLLAHFGDKVYNTIIPRNVRLAEAPSHGLPVLSYDKSCAGALAYLALAGEMLRQNEKAAVAAAG